MKYSRRFTKKQSPAPPGLHKDAACGLACLEETDDLNGLHEIEVGSKAAMARAQAELRLLAAVATIGRWGLALAARAGITIDHFEEPDARAIFAGLLVAERTGKIVSVDDRIHLAKLALQQIDLWDETDRRTFVGNLRWGPCNLPALFVRLSHREAEELLPELAAELLQLIEGCGGVP
jgi:hypothetical protein